MDRKIIGRAHVKRGDVMSVVLIAILLRIALIGLPRVLNQTIETIKTQIFDSFKALTGEGLLLRIKRREVSVSKLGQFETVIEEMSLDLREGTLGGHQTGGTPTLDKVGHHPVGEIPVLIPLEAGQNVPVISLEKLISWISLLI